LIGQEIPSMESLKARLLCVPTLTIGNLHDSVESFVMVSTCERGGHGNKGGRSGPDCPQCSYYNRMGHTQVLLFTWFP